MITCFFENNHKAFLRHVTVDAIMVKNNQILLVRRAPDMFKSGKYCFPGGFLDRDETTTVGILRELLEETGYQGKIISLFRINDRPDRYGEDRQNVDFVYLVEIVKKVAEPFREVISAHWFRLDDLPRKEEFAFDHYETIQLYLKYKRRPFELPFIG